MINEQRYGLYSSADAESEGRQRIDVGRKQKRYRKILKKKLAKYSHKNYEDEYPREKY